MTVDHQALGVVGLVRLVDFEDVPKVSGGSCLR